VSTPAIAVLRSDRRAAVVILGALLGLSAIAWYVTVQQAAGMEGMRADPLTMGGAAFLLMWVVMMVGMMFPTIAPMVLAHRLISKQRGDGWHVSGAFVLGYLVVWAAIGLVPTGLFLVFRSVIAGGSLEGSYASLAGAALIAAGLYQFTPAKRVCLVKCQTPFAFVLEHDFGGGSVSAIKAGISHGAFCAGCCWALMLVLVVVGFMNLPWMAVLAAIFLLEKNFLQGLVANRVLGALVLLLGLAVVIYPGLLSFITGGTLMQNVNPM
jgi:predicted metal-binding membrane protein